MFNVDEIFEALQQTIPDLRAIVVAGAAGDVRVRTAADFQLDVDTFVTEYATLFRIARHTSQDTAMGDTLEQVLIAEKAVLVVCMLESGSMAIFVCGVNQHLGRLRYEIRRLVERASGNLTE